MTGTIADLQSGGFGFIASDACGRPWALIFRRTAVAAGGFDQLQVGQRTHCDQETIPGDQSRSRAVRVGPLD